jgi:hypothetical protein
MTWTRKRAISQMLYLTTSGEAEAEQIVYAAQVNTDPPITALLLVAHEYHEESDFEMLCEVEGQGFIPCWVWDCLECSVRNQLINHDV